MVMQMHDVLRKLVLGNTHNVHTTCHGMVAQPPPQQLTGADSNLQSIPTTNMMEVLKNMISERPGGNNMTLLETMSQQIDPATLSDMDPAARALLEQLVGTESGLSSLSGSSGGPSAGGAASSAKGSNKATPPSNNEK